MKIKTKKQFTLPQLIEWAIDNNIKHRVFESNPNFDGVTYELGFDIDGDLYLEEYLTPTSLFTVEEEVEITEDTEFKSLVEVTTEGLFAYWEHTSINTWKDVHSKEFHAYIDGEFKCVWRDGRLIE